MEGSHRLFLMCVCVVMSCGVSGLSREQVTAAIRNGAVLTDVICPGGSSSCPDGTTCCKMAGGMYGCCPLPHAECCSDGVHCCPNGTTCDLAAGTCNNMENTVTFKAMKKFPARKMNDVICPGGNSSCPDGNTCCLISSSQYGCCPVPNAVCCSDDLHCCPSGYTCRLDGTCIKKNDILKALIKFPAKELNDVICPDGKGRCPDGTTCCQISVGEYGCCPLKDAVCCSDNIHCCPNGSTCDLEHQTCKKKEEVIKAMSKFPASYVGDITCPDGISSCPDGTTCCKVSTGQYGCCPFPEATCCTDNIHCCPKATTCNLEEGTCERGYDTVKASSALKAVEMDMAGNKCPDNSTCPSGTTCCKLTGGTYGCCPMPKAVCCNDHLHCCPEGMTCDVAHQTCNSDDGAVSALTSISAYYAAGNKCPDRSSCPSGTTCCKLSTGIYGCCPMPNAVCCNDHLHCCPEDTTCDTAHGRCISGGNTIKALTKIPAYYADAAGNKCPDGTSCPDGTTCCELTGGKYGCCTMPNAVCCNDHLHCCPEGTTCNTTNQTCNRGGNTIKAMTKIPAISADYVLCPDGASTCPEKTTCCKTIIGNYGCCHHEKGVCCKDHLHCCPGGYTCDGSSCKKAATEMILLEMAVPRLGVVTCPDRTSACPDGTTCCKLTSGGYGCCPMPEATCCSDHIHCCPQGYKCDVADAGCLKNGEKIKAFVKIPAITNGAPAPEIIPPQKSLSEFIQKMFMGKNSDNCVMCPDDSECPDFNTCCQLESGGYGCCAFPSAVCCSDHTHCCQNGYSCDVQRQECYKKGVPRLPMVAMSSTKKTRSNKSPSIFDEI